MRNLTPEQHKLSYFLLKALVNRVSLRQCLRNVWFCFSTSLVEIIMILFSTFKTFKLGHCPTCESLTHQLRITCNLPPITRHKPSITYTNLQPSPVISNPRKVVPSPPCIIHRKQFSISTCKSPP